MYSLVQETYDKGYDSGYDSGMLTTLKRLVDNGLLPLCTAAEQAKMSEETFLQKTSQKK